ncbi:transcription factor domain-containing protein [Aspergillus lucknowensis]|uniref:Fungal-specific transcription factor domain-containing protein n=1 Tax=Aspergillus lucknowensis TaxID=176173 RepID=A0ABR4LIB7_9EURO
MPSRPPTKRSLRQQPGLACEECRRRKVRCDRAQPQCEPCRVKGEVCLVNYNRPRRGPKTGQLKALYSRLHVLEEQLVVQLDPPAEETPTAPEPPSRNSSLSQQSIVNDDDDAPHEPSSSKSSVEAEPRQSPGPPSSSSSPIDIVLADLDQLYFDRVHPIAPFLHQRRYFSWTTTESPSLPRAGLRSAMRTLGAAMSAQFGSLTDKLYAETCQILQQLDGMQCAPAVEQIQALLLLAHYELLHMQESRAMVTAGRCFRLIQLTRLYDTDAHEAETPAVSVPVQGQETYNECFAATEEKRRTFWVAYCFDRFLSSRHEWPLTLQEDAIRTRLPHPDATFQTAPVTLPLSTPQPPFLHEAIASSGHTTLPPFSECIVLATLHGRAMNLRRMATVLSSSSPEHNASTANTTTSSSSTNNANSTTNACQMKNCNNPNTHCNNTNAFWTRHKSLSTLVEQRTQLLARNLASPSGLVDPMLAFTHVLARSTVVYLGLVAGRVVPGSGMESASVTGVGVDCWGVSGQSTVSSTGIGGGGGGGGGGETTQRMVSAAYTRRAFQAAKEIVRLIQGVRPVNCFKAHLFLPSAVSRAAGFLATHGRVTEWEWGNHTGGTGKEVDELLGVLRDVQGVNNMARELLAELEGGGQSYGDGNGIS